MILDGKEVQKVLDVAENDFLEKQRSLMTNKNPEFMFDDKQLMRLNLMTAVQIQTVREIRDRLGIPEIKA